MKAKQKNIRIFELLIESEAEFITYMEKNLILLREYLLLLYGEVTPRVTDYLDEHHCCYKNMNGCNIKFRSSSKSSKESALVLENIKKGLVKQHLHQEEHKKDQDHSPEKTKVLFTPVRSGVELCYEGDITIFSRVNSASKVISEGNVEIYGKIDGVVECNGEYMIAKEIGKGFIIFNGDILEKEHFDGTLKKIYKRGDEVIIEDLV